MDSQSGTNRGAKVKKKKEIGKLILNNIVPGIPEIY